MDGFQKMIYDDIKERFRLGEDTGKLVKEMYEILKVPEEYDPEYEQANQEVMQLFYEIHGMYEFGKEAAAELKRMDEAEPQPKKSNKNAWEVFHELQEKQYTLETSMHFKGRACDDLEKSIKKLSEQIEKEFNVTADFEQERARELAQARKELKKHSSLKARLDNYDSKFFRERAKREIEKWENAEAPRPDVRQIELWQMEKNMKGQQLVIAKEEYESVKAQYEKAKAEALTYERTNSRAIEQAKRMRGSKTPKRK